MRQTAAGPRTPWWRRFGATFEVLSVRDLRLLWTGQLISLLGDQMFLVAMPFVLLTGGHDASRLGVVLLCLGVGRTVAMAAGGSLSDRFRRRLVMLYSDMVRLVLTALLAVVVLFENQPLLVIAALAAMLGLAQGVFLPSSYSIVPELVGEDRIVAANSIMSTQLNLSTLIGPAIGGALVAGASPGVALLADAATFGVSASSLALIRGRPATARAVSEPAAGTAANPPEAAAGPAGQASGEARRPSSYRSFLRYVTSSRLLPFSLLVTFIVNLGYAGMVEIALPALARERFANAPVAFGLLLTGSAIGALTGALTANPILARRNGALLALGTGIVEGLCILLIPVLPGFAGSWLALFLVGTASAVVNVFFVSSLQRTVPREYLGRTMSLLMLAASATSPISYGLVAALVTASGAATAFYLAGAATVTAFAVGFLGRDIRKLALA